MHRFSEAFDYYLKQKKTGIALISKASGIERSTLYQYLRGKRIPPDQERVKLIAGCLRLNHAETEKFLDAYMVSKIGEYTYTSRKQLGHMFAMLMDLDRQSRQHTEHTDRADSAMEEATDAEAAGAPEIGICEGAWKISGKRQIVRQMRKLLDDQSGEFPLYIAAPVISDELFGLVNEAFRKKPASHIRHLVMLNNVDQIMADDAIYNLSFLRQMIPFLVSEQDYICFYLYGDVQTAGEEMRIQPNYLVSGHSVLLFGEDLRDGLLITEHHVVEYYRNLFEMACSEAVQFNQTNALQDVVGHYMENWEQKYARADAVYMFDTGICVTMVLDPDEDGALISGIEQTSGLSEELLGALHKYIEYVRAFKTIQTHVRVLFTRKGIDYFCESGHLTEVFEENQFPLPAEIRVLFLKRWRVLVLNGQARMLNNEETVGRFNLSLLATRLSLSLDKPLPSGKRLVSEIGESSIVSNVFEFMEDTFLHKTVEPEKAAAFLEEKMRKLSSED